MMAKLCGAIAVMVLLTIGISCVVFGILGRNMEWFLWGCGMMGLLAVFYAISCWQEVFQDIKQLLPLELTKEMISEEAV